MAGKYSPLGCARNGAHSPQEGAGQAGAREGPEHLQAEHAPEAPGTGTGRRGAAGAKPSSPGTTRPCGRVSSQRHRPAFAGRMEFAKAGREFPLILGMILKLSKIST